MLKRKNYMQRKSKQKKKKNENALNMVASVFLRDVGVIGCTSKEIVPIMQLWLYVSYIDFLISKIIKTWNTYALLRYFSHNMQNSLLLLIHM